MARTNKKSRIKGLPPRLYIQQRDARSGALPSISRISSDNRTGNFNVFFDDLATVPFPTGTVENFIFGASVPNELLASPYYQEFGQDLSSSLTGSGRPVKGIADTHLAHTPGQAWMPYEEHLEPAPSAKGLTELPGGDFADGDGFFTHLAKLEIQRYNKRIRFYATGSATEQFGAYLDEPLWAKTKIEFDLTPTEEHSFGIFGDDIGHPETVDANYPMAYWNKDTKRYEGVGSGYSLGTRYDTIYNDPPNNDIARVMSATLEEQAIGFGKSMDRGGTTSEIINFDATSYLWHQFARPTTAFGFPYHEKFHAASSSLIPMCDYIDRPFLLEKAVLLVSCSCNMNNTLGYRDLDDINAPPTGYSLTSIATFFILNQRGPVSKVVRQNISVIEDNFATLEEPRDLSLPVSYSAGAGEGRRTDTLDLITYMQIISVNSTMQNSDDPPIDPGNGLEVFQELVIDREAQAYLDVNSVPGTAFWKGSFALEAPVKSLYKTEDYSTLHISAEAYSAADSNGFLTQGARLILRTGENAFGRNGFDVANGRNYSNVYGDVGISSSFPDRLVPNRTITTPVSHSKNNPYLLLPTDSLILGWQVPLDIGLHSVCLAGQQTRAVYKGAGPQLVFPPFPSKLILYGSMLGEGREKHDTLNQLLTSEGVHEAIEGADSPPASCPGGTGIGESPGPPPPE